MPDAERYAQETAPSDTIPVVCVGGIVPDVPGEVH